MSLPVVRRTTYDAAMAKAAEVEAELHREMAAVRETLDRAREDHDAALADRDRVAAALARARAEADRFAAIVAEKQAELAQAAKAFEAQRIEARQAQDQAASEAKAREEAQIALVDTQSRLEQTARRLEDFRSETERLGAQLAQLQAVHRADVEALERTASERDRFANRLKDFEGEAARLGKQVVEIIEDNRSLGAAVETGRADTAAVEKRLNALSMQLRPPVSPPNGRSYFVISSLGRTATQWQVAGLNLHPLVHVTHALDLSKEKHNAASTGDDFLRSLERQASIRKEALDLDAAFDLIESDDYRVFGNIHGLEILPAVEQPEKFRRTYRLFYQTRHPVLRIGSLVRRWAYEASLDASRRQSLKEEANRALDGASVPGADLTDENAWLFAYAVSYLLHSEARYLKSNVPIVLYERLLADRDHFGWFVTQLLGGAVDFSEELINEFHVTAAVDQRNSSPKSAKIVHGSWHDWQRKHFAQTLEKAGTRDHYASLGYAVSF